MKSQKFAEGCQTRGSLLLRVKDWSNQKDWEEFYALYAEMIRSMALRRGVEKAEADDITQDVFSSVARQIPGFEYDQTKGQFRSWLSTIADRRIIDHFRKQRRATEPLPEPDPGSGPPPAGAWIAPPADEALESDQNFQLSLLHRAEEEAKRIVHPMHFQAYDLMVHRNCSVAQVAARLGVRRTTVSLWTFRVTRKVRQITTRLHKLVVTTNLRPSNANGSSKRHS